jgi:uncharacterized protein (TIGR02594 family)
MSITSDYQTALKRKGLYNGDVDGDFGPLTLAAAQALHTAPGKIPQWMLVAAQELGVSEIYGPRDNPRISLYHASTTLGSKPDEVAWCSSFVNWCVQQAGIKGTRSAAARSWDTWGHATDVNYGAVATVPRTGGSGRHVFFIAGYTKTHVFGLGGNQGDKVSVVPYRISSLTAIRWPVNRA